MIKTLWTRFFYRMYFTVWLAVFSAIGSDGITSFYWAVGVGLVIDLARAKFVSTELTGNGSWNGVHYKKISDIWNVKENMLFTIPLLTIVYIWIICILDMYASHQTMDFYFGLFEPIYILMGHQVELIRDHARDLNMHGYASKALLTQHIYTIGLLAVVFGAIWFVCFRANRLTARWRPNNKLKKPNPMTEVWKTLGGIILMAIFWAGLNLFDVEFVRTHRRTINVHEGYSFLAFYFPCFIFGIHSFMLMGYWMLTSAYDEIRSNPKSSH